MKTEYAANLYEDRQEFRFGDGVMDLARHLAANDVDVAALCWCR